MAERERSKAQFARSTEAVVPLPQEWRGNLPTMFVLHLVLKAACLLHFLSHPGLVVAIKEVVLLRPRTRLKET